MLILWVWKFEHYWALSSQQVSLQGTTAVTRLMCLKRTHTSGDFTFWDIFVRFFAFEQDHIKCQKGISISERTVYICKIRSSLH